MEPKWNFDEKEKMSFLGMEGGMNKACLSQFSEGRGKSLLFTIVPPEPSIVPALIDVQQKVMNK